MEPTMEMYKKRLARGQATYTQGKEDAAKNSFGPKDPGQYKLQLLSIDIDDISTSNGNVLVAKILHTILEGPNEQDIGETVMDSLFLEGNQGEKDRTDEFINRFFNNLGYEAPAEKAELPDAFASLVAAAPVYIAKVTMTRDELYNRVRIIRPCEDEGGAETGTAGTAGAANTGAVDNGADGIVDDGAGTEEVVVDPNFSPLCEFASAFGQDITQMSMEEAVQHLGAFPWDFTQLQVEEVKLLENVGLGDKITNRPAPAATRQPARRPAAAAAAPASNPVQASATNKNPAATAPAAKAKGGGLKKRT